MKKLKSRKDNNGAEEIYRLDGEIIKVARVLEKLTGGWYGYLVVSVAPEGSDWEMLYGWEWDVVYSGKRRGFGDTSKASARKRMNGQYRHVWGL